MAEIKQVIVGNIFIEERFKKTLAAVLETTPDKVDESMSYDTLHEWDSLKQMNIIVAMEDEFGISFEEVESVLLNDYQSLYKAVESKVVGG